MKNASEYVSGSSKLALLQRGASGSYKSRASLRLALRWGGVLILDLDQNFSSLLGMVPSELLPKVLIEDCTPPDLTGLVGKEVSKARLEIFLKTLEMLKTTKDLPIQTVVLDTYSSLTVLVNDTADLKKEYQDPKYTMAKFGWIRDTLLAIMMALKQLPFNVIVNVHEEFAQGSYKIVGVGSATDLWTTVFAEKVRLSFAQSDSLKIKVCNEDGLKSSRIDLADNAGVIAASKYWNAFDAIAKKDPDIKVPPVFKTEKF